MWFSSWLRNRQRDGSPRQRPTYRPRLEALEDRWLPSTLTVTNTLDSGAGSLRAEVAAAQNGDTINFALSPGSTINLTTGELLINKNLTIAGPGAGELTVSGNASRVFEVKGNHQVSLSGLTISNGHASNGGGIEVDAGSTLAVSNSTLSGNFATSGVGGGGIDNYGMLTRGHPQLCRGESCVV